MRIKDVAALRLSTSRYSPTLQFVLTLVSVTVARAVTFTWDGGGTDNNWKTDANWNPDGAPVSGGTIFEVR